MKTKAILSVAGVICRKLLSVQQFPKWRQGEMKAISFKRNLVITAIILLVGGFVIPSAGLAYLDSGLVAYWSFDNGDAMDESGNENHGTIYGNPEIVVNGIIGYAFRFDGIDDCIVIDSTEDFRLPEWSVCTWAKLEQIPSGDTRFVGKDADINDKYNFALLVGSLTHVRSQYETCSSEFDHCVGCYEGDSKISLDQWYFLVSVRNHQTGTHSLFINGSEVDQGTWLDTPCQNNEHVIFAGTPNGTTFLKGSLDEVRIYNRPLSDAEIEDLFNSPRCDSLYLHSGWQWVSTNVDPNPCEMESIFVNCWGDLGIIIACDGSFCIPGVGCWIDCWNVCEMYKLHMADACTVEVCGSKVPTDKPCPLPAGWNWIAYFPDCPLEPETALVSIWDNLDIVIAGDGSFCIPGVGCWIECMRHNEGYIVHLSHADTLIYPTTCPPCPPPFAKKKSFPGFARTTHFNYSRNTGESYSIVVNSVELDGKHPEVGDEIGVFTSSELCVGAGLWQEEILGIAIWQDDDRTEVVDGFQVGEQMVFKLWDKDENKETELSVSFEKGDGKFGTVADPASGGDAYALVSLKGISSQLPERFELAQNYPNPFNPETKISYALPKDCHVKLTIYNMLGQKIKVLVDEHQTAGHKNVHWDGKDYKGNEVASGIYFFRIEAGDLTQSKKMVILK